MFRTRTSEIVFHVPPAEAKMRQGAPVLALHSEQPSRLLFKHAGAKRIRSLWHAPDAPPHSVPPSPEAQLALCELGPFVLNVTERCHIRQQESAPEKRTRLHSPSSTYAAAVVSAPAGQQVESTL